MSKTKSKFYFNGVLWDSKKHSNNDINEHLNTFMGAPDGQWYAMADVFGIGGDTVTIKIQRHYNDYNVPKDADWIGPEDASLLLGYHVPAPFGDKLNIQYKTATVEDMFREEKMGNLRIVGQSEDELVVEIEKR